MTRVLVVTAVPAERDAVRAACPQLDVIAVGVGPAAAAAGTALALAAAPAGLVISVGIAGGFAGVGPGAIAVASASVFADLGAETADGFRSAAELEFGREHYPVAPWLAVELADRTGGRLGTVLTVATVTGTAATAEARLRRHPDAVAEAMEGAGVAAAAEAHGVAFAEVRAISNLVGPRERGSWRVPEALTALGRAVAAATAAPLVVESLET